MGAKPFDLIETISGLLKKIDEGQQIIRQTQSVNDDFWKTCANRDRTWNRVDELQREMPFMDEPTKALAQAKLARTLSEYYELDDESRRLRRQLGETTSFIDPFIQDVLLLSERLPLKPEWDVYRQALVCLDVGARDSWTDPPYNSGLETLEMRLLEMLDLARETQPRSAPKNHASRQGRGPNLQLSRERIDLEDTLGTELATVTLELRRMTSLSELRKKFPNFQIWQMLSDPEQQALLNEPFKPKSYAKHLVLRHFALTSEETLKKDRKKLRTAAKKPSIS